MSSMVLLTCRDWESNEVMLERAYGPFTKKEAADRFLAQLEKTTLTLGFMVGGELTFEAKTMEFFARPSAFDDLVEDLRLEEVNHATAT